MDPVGSVGLSIKVLRDELKADVKDAVRDAAKEAQKETDKSFKGINKSIGGTTSSLGGLVSMAKKAMGALGVAFSIGQVVKFAGACIDLGSDLAEVQNVVDVVYQNMSSDVNDFAASAIKSYGISETVAKNYMGTLGAMSKAFGFTEKEAYDQAESLTGLAADMASFYNKSTDETFNALKAVYSGETEVLKQYGVVMSETALNEFALSQGINKTVKEMSEQEKVSLRLAFIQDRLSAASGDFQRTSGGWANQVRVLTLQFDAFKASIGQGLINVLTPIVQWLNMIMEAANKAAKAFSNFTASIMGITVDENGGISGIADVTADASDNMQDFTSGVKSAGGAAKKAMQKLAGFDRINTLSSDSSSGGGGGGSSASKVKPAIQASTDSTGEAESAASKWKDTLGGIVQKVKEIKQSFAEGFDEGFADFDIQPTLNNLSSARDSLVNIFTNPTVQSAGESFMHNLANGMGKGAGSLARIGSVSAQTVTGGIAKFLQEHNTDIRHYITDMFDISGEIANTTGNLSVSVASIFQGAFGTNAGESLVSSLINIPYQIFSTTTEIGAKLARDILGGFYTIIGGNEGELTTVMSGLVEFASTAFGAVSTAVTDMGNTIQSVYDTYINPFISGMSSSISDLLGVILNFWEGNVQPILDMIGQKAQILWNEHFKSLFDNLVGFFGRICSLIQVLWVTYLQPVVAWIIKNILPVIMPIIRTVIAIVMEVVGAIGSAISGIMAVLNGLIDFITGVITGNWSLAWEGIKEIFSGVWFDGILPILNSIGRIFGDVFSGIVDTIKAYLNMGIAAVESWVNGVLDGVNRIISTVNAASNAAGGPDLVNPVSHISLPRLAQGGFVKANTPQLAIIGDNKHEGEIVAPESKIAEAVATAMMQILPYLKGANNTAAVGGDYRANVTLELDGQVLYETVESYRQQNNSRSGGRA